MKRPKSKVQIYIDRILSKRPQSLYSNLEVRLLIGMAWKAGYDSAKRDYDTTVDEEG